MQREFARNKKLKSLGSKAGAKVRPNPSLNTPTRYGRQRKPGLSHITIVSVQAYGACLRGRG